MDKCEVRRCRQFVTIIYAVRAGGRHKGVCWKHWRRHCEDNEVDDFDLRVEFVTPKERAA